MTPLEIQFELKKLGIEQQKIAEDLGVSSTAVSRVINRKNLPSDRIQKAVAKAIGMDYRAVFPDLYLKQYK